MKIRLAILEKDTSYLNRMVSAFGTKYADKVEIYSFTDEKIALSNLDANKIDVLLASDLFDIDAEALPRRCGFAYLVEGVGIDSVKEQVAICKFQRADLIYKQILGLYSETTANVSGMKIEDSACKVIMVTSPSGGVGTSTMAAACATRLAREGRKVFYLDLALYGSTNAFFTAEGQFDMSDIIYALKGRKTNISLKIESCLKRDANGVYFFSQPKLILDMMELGNEEIIKLISELKVSGEYEYIIIDKDFGIRSSDFEIFGQANEIVLVGDGSYISNSKIANVYTAIQTLEQNMDFSVLARMSLIYNKFSNKTSKLLEQVEIKSHGGAPRFEHATEREIVEQLANMNLFGPLL